METNDFGSLDDVAAARRAIRRQVKPWWLWVSAAIGGAGVYAVAYGMSDHRSWILFALLIAAVFVFAGGVKLYQRSVGEPVRVSFSVPQAVVIGVTICVQTILGETVRNVLTPGTATVFVVEFVAALAVFGAGLSVVWFMERRADRVPSR